MNSEQTSKNIFTYNFGLSFVHALMAFEALQIKVIPFFHFLYFIFATLTGLEIGNTYDF